MNGPVTVVLVDDHAMVRRGVADFLATQEGMQVVAEASGAAQAVSAVRDLAPDVALVDLVLPGTSGVELIGELARTSPRTAIVVLTSFADDQLLFPALRSGALSYLLKDVGPEDLAHAVRQAAAGEAILHPDVAARVAEEFSGATGHGASGGQELTSREREVLRLVADGHSNAQIAARLFISEKTVKSHVSNVLAKLHLADRTQAAAYAWRRGIVRP
jgi:NarL family two-component system response regulator LiaR